MRAAAAVKKSDPCRSAIPALSKRCQRRPGPSPGRIERAQRNDWRAMFNADSRMSAMLSVLL
jgi:hypothetical protein